MPPSPFYKNHDLLYFTISVKININVILPLGAGFILTLSFLN